jgi:hypothetical protein
MSTARHDPALGAFYDDAVSVVEPHELACPPAGGGMEQASMSHWWRGDAIKQGRAANR